MIFNSHTKVWLLSYLELSVDPGTIGPGPSIGGGSRCAAVCELSGLLELAEMGEAKAKESNNNRVMVLPAEGQFGRDSC